METFWSIIHWFSGGETQYHTLRMCMMNDGFWITTTVVLDLLVAAGYILIAYHWWQNEKKLSSGPARTALTNMRNIFVFCGICGYLFIPIKMIWPAWRLYDCFVVFLVYFTWRYALSSRQLKVIYSELGMTKQLAEDLRKSRDESRKRGFFLNAVSHDLRTPLNALSLQAGLMDIQLSSGNTEALRDVAADIRANARVAAELLDSLLEYARLNESPDNNTLSEIDLHGVIGAGIDAFRPAAAEKSLFIRVECPRGLSVRTDARKMSRIIRNLVGNAVKYTHTGGVTLKAEIVGTALEIRVIDTGIGIAIEHQEHLFDDFYQVANSERDRKKGFGLGLAIARQLARQLGGDISCHSTLGNGCCFCVQLPVSPAAIAENGPHDGPVESGAEQPAGAGR